jgi:hypothetical protein
VGTLIGGTIAAAKSGLGFGLDIFKAGAEGFAESRYPGLPTNGNIRDASRHFHLSFSMSRMGGAASATQMLNSIEVLGNNPAAEQRMDTYNNYVGVTMAQDPAFRGKSAAEAFDAALAAGCLITNAN